MEAIQSMTEPHLTYREALPYVAIRKRVAMSDIPTVVPPLWPEVISWLTEQHLAPTGDAFIRYLQMDKNHVLEVEVGFPVASAPLGNQHVQAGVFPNGHYVALTHMGHYSGLFNAWGTLEAWMERKKLKEHSSQSKEGYEWGMRAEFYPTDPEIELNPEKWQTDLLCLLSAEEPGNATKESSEFTDKLNQQKASLMGELEKTTTELLQTLATFNQETINRIPFEGSWTAAQVGDHLLKSYTGMLQALYGQVKPTERKPDEKVAELKATFLNFDTKLQSPKFIIPTSSVYEKETLLTSLQSTIAQLMETLKATDLSQTCLGFTTFGDITRLEIFHFIVFHTQRHIHQIKKY
jgi:effector-binding domain-containing protein